MVQEINDLGIQVMVSMWPVVQTQSHNYPPMLESGYFIEVCDGK